MNNQAASRKYSKIIWPVLILLMGAGIAWGLISMRSEQNHPAPPSEALTVQVIRAHPQTLSLNVRSQGVVAPRTEIDLIPEVTGRVVKLHPAFVTGETFKPGDVLVTIDPRDYDHAITRAQALVAEAKHRLAREEEEADQARYEWQVLGRERPPTPLMLREPQLAEARAKLKAAEADLVQARLQRSRCEWRSPFLGKIRHKSAGPGQFVQPGGTLARLYAVDIAEVRLPLAMDQLTHIEWPMESQPATGKQPGTLRKAAPKVILTAQFSGVSQYWEGRIARLEGALNETTGVLYAVAEIDLVRAGKESQFLFLPGLFVQAEIEGRARPGLFKLPREAVTANRAVLKIDADGRLRTQPVHLSRIETDHVLVSSGLEDGDLIVAAAVQVPIEGIKVRYEIIEPKLEAKQSVTGFPASITSNIH